MYCAISAQKEDQIHFPGGKRAARVAERIQNIDPNVLGSGPLGQCSLTLNDEQCLWGRGLFS